MRLLFVGDIVGRAGRTALINRLPALRARWRLDFVVVNGENAAGGFGITEAICEEFLAAGVDAITLGNHAFDQREALVFIERQPRLIRPANYPAGTPGRGANLFEAAGGAQVLVVNLMGRVFMDALDDPFQRIEAELAACPLGVGCDAAVVDFHAEATSEKQAFGHFVDGRVSLVVGTHTHVQTADARILPGGAGFITDVGMTGDCQFGDRHGQGRAAAPLHPPHSLRPLRAGRRRGDVVRRRGRDRRRRARAPHRAVAPRRRACRRRTGFLERLRSRAERVAPPPWFSISTARSPTPRPT